MVGGRTAHPAPETITSRKKYTLRTRTRRRISAIRKRTTAGRDNTNRTSTAAKDISHPEEIHDRKRNPNRDGPTRKSFAQDETQRRRSEIYLRTPETISSRNGKGRRTPSAAPGTSRSAHTCRGRTRSPDPPRGPGNHIPNDCKWKMLKPSQRPREATKRPRPKEYPPAPGKRLTEAARRTDAEATKSRA